MCIAVPGEILEIKGYMAITDIMGIEQEICIAFIEEVKAGDIILIHAGYAISKLLKEEGLEVLKFFKALEVAHDEES